LFSYISKIILDAVDRIEDELDAQIPLPFRIRIFFEEYLFGWDHLTSDIIGSLFYPLAMSVMQYYIFTFLWMDHSLFEEIMTIIFDYLCMIIYKEKMVDFVGDSCWNFSVEWNHFVTNYAFAFKMIRFIYSLIVGMSVLFFIDTIYFITLKPTFSLLSKLMSSYCYISSYP